MVKNTSTTHTKDADPVPAGSASVFSSSAPKDALEENIAAATASMPRVSDQSPNIKREKFNTLLHVSSDGTAKGAKTNADGTYQRKRGRPLGSTKIRNPEPSGRADDPSNLPVDPAAEAAERRARCEGKIRLTEGFLAGIVGDHARLDRAEREVILEPLIECDRQQLFGEALDPRWTLLIVCALIAVPKILHPDTADNLRKFAERLRNSKKNRPLENPFPHTTRSNQTEPEK